MARPPLPRELREMLARLERDMERAFRAAIAGLGRNVDMAALTAAIAAGDEARAAALLGVSPATFAGLEDQIRGAFNASGAAQLAGLPALVDPATGRRFKGAFDGRHQRAQRWVSERAGGLITGLVDDQLTVIREVMRNGLADDRGIQAIARDLVGRRVGGTREGGVVGLSPRQAEAVKAARLELEARGERLLAHLDRRLRDRRFDGLLRRAAAEGRSLSAAEVNRIIEGYSRRLLRYRGEMIARTEVIQAHRAGRHEAMAQLVDRGVADRSQIVREWSTALDERVRDSHMDMHGQTVTGLDTPFIMPDGRAVMFPDEPNCRCVVIERIRA